MKSASYIQSLTEDDVWNKIRFPEEYPFSTFTREDFTYWMDYITSIEYDQGYQDGCNDS